MNLSLNQTKLVGLTMQLDLKAKEYKNLCEIRYNKSRQFAKKINKQNKSIINLFQIYYRLYRINMSHFKMFENFKITLLFMKNYIQIKKKLLDENNNL